MSEETTDRPSMAEDTTDWELVFEHPKTGIFPLIAQAPSPGALQECANLVIQKLFPHQEDQQDLEHLAAKLAKIIPDGATQDQMAEMRDSVTGLLREIKDERIRLAAATGVRKKKKKGAAKERRGARPKRRRKVKSPSRAAAWAGWTVTVAVVIAGFAYLVTLSDRPIELAPASELVAQMKLAAKSGTMPIHHVYGGALKRQMIGGNIDITAMEVPQKPCVNAAWSLAESGQVVINGVSPARITAPILAELCARDPQAGEGRTDGGADGGKISTGAKPTANVGATLTWYP